MIDVKIFTDNIEEEALDQVHTLSKLESFKDTKIRIMPDVHAGKGCVIGFTADITLNDSIIPNLVGVDLGCGMLTVELGKVDIDLEKLDNVIKTYVPSGYNVHEEQGEFDLTSFRMSSNLKDRNRILCSIGTLGGGNHFIEVDEDTEGNKYLVIHSGSRNLGLQVANYYQDLAYSKLSRVSEEDRKEVIETLKAQGRQREIPEALKALTPEVKVPKDLAHLTGKDKEDYLHDSHVATIFAMFNREVMANTILDKMGLTEVSRFETIHNYIGKDGILRKGAISANKGEKVLIPINMRDGCIIGIGKGNSDWNCSAPHGAGRIMSRSKARELLDEEQFSKDMEGVYTTTANKSTLDESPRVYKPMEEILEKIKDTIEVVKIIKPIYNFKATQ